MGRIYFFWQDNWIENRSLLEIMEIENYDTIDLNLKVSEFIENNRWNTQKLCQYISKNEVINKILGIHIPTSGIKDTFCWGLSSSGEFTMKSATWLANDQVQGTTP